MNLSREGAMELIGHEAIVLTRYKDSVGVWTIGVGHTRAAGAPDPATFEGEMTLAEVFALFEKDVRRYVADVNSVLKVKVTQQQFDALVSFHYNTGAIKRASLMKHLNDGDIIAAGDGLMEWVKPVAVTERRRKEHNLFTTGRYSNGGAANIYPADANGHVNFRKPKRVNLNVALNAAPPPPDIPKRDVPPPKKPGNVGGAIAGGTVIAGGAVIANKTKEKGASTGDIIMAGALIAVIAVAAFFIIRHWRRS